ncbi:hypothetical protein C8R43DRAFT_134991 [Mycena crocata]|nr:hypothetical protein C8R43DRAFT_134991 [Mycena crocata]
MELFPSFWLGRILSVCLRSTDGTCGTLFWLVESVKCDCISQVAAAKLIHGSIRVGSFPYKFVSHFFVPPPFPSSSIYHVLQPDTVLGCFFFDCWCTPTVSLGFKSFLVLGSLELPCQRLFRRIFLSRWRV